MKTMLKTFGVVAALVVGGVAAAAQAEEVRIPVGDLNLNSSAGRAQFEARVDAAAKRMCSDDRELARYQACTAAFHAEADENLSAQMARLQGVSLASTRR